MENTVACYIVCAVEVGKHAGSILGQTLCVTITATVLRCVSIQLSYFVSM